MTKLDQRKEQILNFIVRDYTDRAIPVSSGRVVNEAMPYMSPATIRNIMLELDNDGYLAQPYTSAGRIPTKAGYRYFVEHLMEECDPPDAMRDEMDNIIDCFVNDADVLFSELSQILARELRLFSGAGILGRSTRLFGYGLAEVFQEPEFSEHVETIKFGKFVDNISEKLTRSSKAKTEKVPSPRHVSIGPFGMVNMFAKNTALGECVIFCAGPQRMNYEKASSFLKYAVDDLTNMSKKLNKV